MALAALALATGCDRTGPASGVQGPAASEAPKVRSEAMAEPKPAPKARPLVFRAQELPFRYERGDSGKALPVETTGGGVGLLDFDGDGDLDLFFAQGGPLGEAKGERPADVLLRNEGKGVFKDVSREVGLTVKGYGQGVTVADFDGDGDPDVYVTRWGKNTLWRNDGGKFTDVTEDAGVGVRLWSLGAAFFDYDGDGDLDLFVSNYFGFDPEKAPFERDPETGGPEYGMPQRFEGQPDNLFRNDGRGRFTDVTERAKIAGKGRGMGAIAADLDFDGRMDVLVANDAMANAAWRNNGDGTFEDRAPAWGLAYNGEGQAEANMGIARGDTDGDGLDDLLITHFFNEHDTLWRPLRVPGVGVAYRDMTFAAGLGSDSRPFTGWGTALADFDQDGYLDLVVVNGHIRREKEQAYPYENPPLLWRNRGDGRFANVTSTAGPFFKALHQCRGLAAGDLDGDGDLDLVVVRYYAPSVVLWNETPEPGHWLIVSLDGAGPNRDAVGAVATATIGGRKLVRSVVGGGGYISASDRRLHFGLGAAKVVDRLEVRWPSGRVEVREAVAADRVLDWDEGGRRDAGP